MDLLCVGRHGLLTMRRFIAIAFLLATSQAWAAFGYYSPISISDNAYYSPISINAAQVPSTQTDFPVLVSVTDTRFKTVGNGGHVQNANGYDIRPYTDTTLSTAITGYELERYNATTGEVVMWVKVSSLSSSTTPIVLRYGDASQTTDGSSRTTWDSNFKLVAHLADGTTLSTKDSSQNSLADGSKVNTPTATTGQIDGGMNLASASSQSSSFGNSLNYAALTYTAWVNPTTLPNAYNAMVAHSASSTNYASMFVKSNGKLNCEVKATTARAFDGTGSHTLSTGTSYYIAMSYDSSGGLKTYVNAASDQTVSANGAADTTAIDTSIGNSTFAGTSWNGKVDEVRISNIARSADWISTEYNNQSAPGTFMTLGSEVSRGVPSTQTDFPVLVSVTDARFKDVAHSGHVQSSSGFDIRPYTNSGLGTAITGYELERYNSSTGEVVMWVKVSSLSSSTTPFVLAYGDSGISTDGSSTTTWSNSYMAVYHLADGTTLNVNSATGSNNGTNHSATATTGQIDGGASLVSASSQYIDIGTAFNPAVITMSAWVKGTSFPNAYNTVISRHDITPAYTTFYVRSDGKLAMYVTSQSGDVHYDGSGTHTLSSSTSYYTTLVWRNAGNPNGGLFGYLNAALDGSSLTGGAGVILDTVAGVPAYVGKDPVNAGQFWNGTIDQLTISSASRTIDWITTEYNNQSAPGTFETLGTEVALTATNNGWFFFFP